LVVEGRVGIDRVCLLSGDESLPRIAQPNTKWTDPRMKSFEPVFAAYPQG
jgi:hypothetical protein